MDFSRLFILQKVSGVSLRSQREVYGEDDGHNKDDSDYIKHKFVSD